MDLRPILLGLGAALSGLALFMLLPMAADLLAGNREWPIFAASAAAVFFLGQLLMLVNRVARFDSLAVRQIVLMTAAVWLGLSFAGSLPFYGSTQGLSFTDSLFEAVGGLTATGATIMRGLDLLPPGILLWRALLQWLGGMGVLAMAVLVLPALGIGGMQFFRYDTGGLAERSLARAGRVALALASLYAGLTALLGIALWAAGMGPFDALAHALSTISCGGFSTSDQSIGHWHKAAVDWVVLVGMVVGGAPFIAYLHLIQRRGRQAARNTQLRWYLSILAASALLLAFWLMFERNLKPLPALRHGAFTAASVLTGTGYATLDWGHWGGMPFTVLFFLSFIGGCAGSTAGGLKIFRLQILIANVETLLQRLVRPNAVLIPRYEKKQIPEEVTESVLGFLLAYILAFATMAILLGLCGLDFRTALSAAVSALANLGPGLSPSISPLTGYWAMPAAAKWILAAGMLFGRLEMFIFLSLFTRSAWRG